MSFQRLRCLGVCGWKTTQWEQKVRSPCWGVFVDMLLRLREVKRWWVFPRFFCDSCYRLGEMILVFVFFHMGWKHHLVVFACFFLTLFGQQKAGFLTCWSTTKRCKRWPCFILLGMFSIDVSRPKTTHSLGGGFKDFLCSPRNLGKMMPKFDEYFWNGLNMLKPPSRLFTYINWWFLV